jgi:ribonuclease HII
MERTGELFPLESNISPEKRLRKMGYRHIAGVDEVGRGALAGPVVAAAVILRRFDAGFVAEIDDSKKLTADLRETLDKRIRRFAAATAVGLVGNQEIDRVNILQASFEAMRVALAGLQTPPDFVLVDGHLPLPGIAGPQRSLVSGDARSKSIGAASIVAKVHRDALMRAYHTRYPQYNFASNKGYGTPEHWAALQAHGPCPLHRLSFQGVAAGEINVDQADMGFASRLEGA